MEYLFVRPETITSTWLTRYRRIPDDVISYINEHNLYKREGSGSSNQAIAGPSKG